MSTYSLAASGAGTKEWLDATKHLTIRAHTESSQPPESVGDQPLTKDGFESMLRKVSRRAHPSPPDEPASTPPAQEPQESPAVATARTNRTVQIPLTGAPWVLLQIPYPMTEANWTEMEKFLELMKKPLTTAR